MTRHELRTIMGELSMDDLVRLHENFGDVPFWLKQPPEALLVAIYRMNRPASPLTPELRRLIFDN